MSTKKTLFGLLLILCTFSLVFLLLSPNIYGDNPAGKFKKEISVDLDFLKEENKPIVLMFFGDVTCSNICIPALNELSKVYKQLDKDKVSFYFINLQHNLEPKIVKSYANAFNKDFKGIYLTYETIMEMSRKIDFNYRPAIGNKSSIEHSGYLHLFVKDKNKYTQKFIYTTRPFKIKYIVEDIKKIYQRG